jgi:hypothetical protein
MHGFWPCKPYRACKARSQFFAIGWCSDMKKHNVAIAFILLLIGLLCLILVPLHTVDRKGRVEYLIKVNPRTFPYLMSLLMTILSAGNLIFTLLRLEKLVMKIRVII